MSVSRRDIVASLFSIPMLPGAPEAPPPAALGRLVKPKIGPVLAAWVAEKPSAREAEVEIDWRKGMLEVDVREGGQYVSRHVDESHPGSFAVSDADAKSLIAEMAAKVEISLRPEPAPTPLLSSVWWRKFDGVFDDVTGGSCQFAAHQEGDVVYSSALWSPSERSPKWVIYATEWSVSDFIAVLAKERSLGGNTPLHMDRWASNATMLALQHRGIQVSAFSTSRSACAAGANFIHHKAYSDALRHSGPKSQELGVSLCATDTVVDEFGNLIVKRPDGRVRAFLMAAAVAASKEKINEPS